MALDDDIRILAGVALFEGFSPEQLRLLAFGVERIRLAPEQELYREGWNADGAYLVVRGRITLYRDVGGHPAIVGTARPGSILGELALIAETRRLTGAVAAVDSELVRIERKAFRRILEEYPDLAVSLHRRIAEELQTLIQGIERVGGRLEE